MEGSGIHSLAPQPTAPEDKQKPGLDRVKALI